MEVFGETLGFTLVILGLAFACLCIGIIVQGRARIRPGSCSLVPGKKGCSNPKAGCSLCGGRKVSDPISKHEETSNDNSDTDTDG